MAKQKDQNELFELIHSLSKSEKRYFKQSAGHHKRKDKSNYILLFDAIAEMDEWSLEELQTKVSDIGNLPTTMTQLGKLIFKALGQLSRRHNPIHQLRDLMVAIENAHDKGLYGHYEKLINKAEELAAGHDKFHVLLELVGHRRQLIYLSEQPDLTELSGLQSREIYLLNQIRIDSAYAQVYHQIFQRMGTRSRAIGAKEKAEFREYRKIGLVENVPVGDSLFSRISFHGILGMIAFALGEPDEAHRQYKSAIGIWQSEPHQIETHQARFLEHFSNYLSTWLLKNDKEGYRKALEKFRNLRMKADSARIKQEEHLQLHELIFYMNFGGYEEGKAHVIAFSDWMQKNQNQVSVARWLLIYHNIAVYYFLNDECSAARSALSEILKPLRGKTRADVRSFARIFDLVLLYELRRKDPKYYEGLLESRSRTILRSLDKDEKISPLEEEVLAFMKRADQAQSREEMMEIFHTSKRALEAIRDGIEPGERPPVGCHELLFWLESRIAGIPLRTLFEQKLRERDQAAGA